MDGQIYNPAESLLHGGEVSTRRMAWTFSASLILHIVFFAAFFLMPEPAPRADFSPSVIDVTMVSLAPAPAPAPVEPEPAVPAPAEPPLITAEDSEVVVESEAPVLPPQPEPAPAPEPEPAPEPVAEPAPAPEVVPETPREQVVIEDAPEENPPVKPAPTVAKAEPDEPPQPPVKRINPQARKPEKQTNRVVQPEALRSDSIKDAIEQVREKVAKETQQQARQVASATPSPAPGPQTEGARSSGGRPGRRTGPISDIWKTQVRSKIEQNWAFSEHLMGGRKLQSVVRVSIQPNGRIADIWFEKRSGDKNLDDSAYRAVMKSDPFPPLPRGYTGYTLGLVFTPSGLN